MTELKRLTDAKPGALREYKAWLSAVAEWWLRHCQTPLAGQQHALLCKCVELVPVHAASARVLAYMPRGPQLIAYDQEEVLRFLFACGDVCDSIDKQLADWRHRQERTRAGTDQAAEGNGSIALDLDAWPEGDEQVQEPPGGRPREWDDLWEMIQEDDRKSPKPKDQVIAGRYNKRFGNGIGKGKRKRATVDIVRNVRYERTKRNRE